MGPKIYYFGPGENEFRAFFASQKLLVKFWLNDGCSTSEILKVASPLGKSNTLSV